MHEFGVGPKAKFAAMSAIEGISIIDGWQAASSFFFKDNLAGVHVTLVNGYLQLTTRDVAEGDLTLARRFDWKALQATISTFEIAN